jgi:iron-sulfur cluster repair protein YtfE (RIC family)
VNRMKRRHESLVPLSREHHYALMLCLRINRGLAGRVNDADWLQAKALQATLFFASNLVAHFKAEEEILFPSMRSVSSASGLIAELLAEHRRIEGLVEELRLKGSLTIAASLREFAKVLEAHIRKEERQLFPIWEREFDGSSVARLSEQIGNDIRAMVGSALQPNNPELLKP